MPKEMKTKKDLVLNIPGPDDEGYLKRNLRIEEIRRSNDLPAMIEFVLEYVDKPEDRGEARELLLMASRNEWDQIMNGLAGFNVIVDPQTPGDSNTG